MHNNALRNLSCMANICIYRKTTLLSPPKVTSELFLPPGLLDVSPKQGFIYSSIPVLQGKDQTLFALSLVCIVSVSITHDPLLVHTTFFFSSAK